MDDFLRTETHGQSGKRKHRVEARLFMLEQFAPCYCFEMAAKNIHVARFNA